MEAITSHDPATEWLHGHASYLRTQFPIHFAACEGDIQRLCSLLADADPADVNLEDDFFGWTPTHWAAYFGQLPALMCLNKHGVNFDAVTERATESPTHLAAHRGQAKCLKWLIQCGARIGRQDHLGDTPLHKAARIGSIECASLLISQGASMEVLNYTNMTPAYLAEHHDHKECAAHIRQLQYSYASRLPKLLPASSSQHSQAASMDCDMDTSEAPAMAQPPHQTLPNGFHPFSAPPAAQNGFHPMTNGFPAQAPSQNGFHPEASGFPAQAQAPTQNGFHLYAAQSQPGQQNGFCGAQMNGSVLSPPGHGSLKRGREEDEESQQKRPCPEARFEANNNTMVMLNSSSLQDLHSSIVASLHYDHQMCENVGLPNATS